LKSSADVVLTSAKGQVTTPAVIVDMMVEKLFSNMKPKPTDFVIEPGCGEGAFIEGILRYCDKLQLETPRIIGVELDANLAEKAGRRFANCASVEILEQDYLDKPIAADFIIGNPPYVPITELDERQKARYRGVFKTAVERFDLYLLFFEQSVKNLKQNGRLCFVTPEKFEYVHTAAPLRRLLADLVVEEIQHIDEETFSGLVTYPTITTVEKRKARLDEKTRVRSRDGQVRSVKLPPDGSAWIAALQHGADIENEGLTLEGICVRVSAGVATGADEVFALPEKKLPRELRKFAYPTISGRDLRPPKGTEILNTEDVMLVPYDREGNLLPEEELGSLRTYLSRRRERLEKRTCVSKGKRKWYAFHENVPLRDILRPKFLCKDIASEPAFWSDKRGLMVPRHSVYYIVPNESVRFDRLLVYLNSPEVHSWLEAHCQRAANGFYRLQSSVMKLLPVPRSVVVTALEETKQAAPQ